MKDTQVSWEIGWWWEGGGGEEALLLYMDEGTLKTPIP